MDFQSIITGTLWMMALIILPGVALSLALFPRKDQLELLERAGLSFVLGLTPLLLHYLLDKNLGIAVETPITYGLIAFVTLLGFAVWKIRSKEN